MLVSIYNISWTLLIIWLAAQGGKRAVVVGSSFISMELVTAMSQRNLASIDVIGMEEFPFEAVLGKAIGEGLMKVTIRCLYHGHTFLQTVLPLLVSRIERHQISYV